MNPLLIAGIVAGFAFLKSRAGEKKQGETVSGTDIPPASGGQNNKGPSDTSYFIGDVVRTGAGVAGALGGIGTVAGIAGAASGTGITSGLSILGSAGSAVIGTLGLAIIPLSLLAALVALGVVGSKLNTAKDFAKQMRNLLPSARAMCAYEDARFSELCRLNNINVTVERCYDQRLEQSFSADGQQFKFIGERGIYSTVNNDPLAGIGRGYINVNRKQPFDFVTVQKAMRTASLFYVMNRWRYAMAFLKNWGPLIGVQPYQSATEDFVLNHWYDDLAGYEGEKLGGLNQIPLPGGYTEKPRDDIKQMHPEASQLRGVNTEPLPKGDVYSWLPEARFMAFSDALSIIQYDNAVYFPFDGARYARDVYNRMELSEPDFVLKGTRIILPAKQWGFPGNNSIDVVQVKDLKGGTIQSLWFSDVES